MCVQMGVCEEYNDYIIYYFDGLNVYIILDLVLRVVSARCGAIEMTTVIAISVEQTHKRLKRTEQSVLSGSSGYSRRQYCST